MRLKAGRGSFGCSGSTISYFVGGNDNSLWSLPSVLDDFQKQFLKTVSEWVWHVVMLCLRETVSLSTDEDFLSFIHQLCPKKVSSHVATPRPRQQPSNWQHGSLSLSPLAHLAAADNSYRKSGRLRLINCKGSRQFKNDQEGKRWRRWRRRGTQGEHRHHFQGTV